MSFARVYLGPASTAGYSKDNLEAFLRLSVEENLNLDYKNIKSLENPDRLAIAVTAMANSAGGLIVLGVDENTDGDDARNPIRVFPGRITWGEKANSREKLESLLISRIQPWINGLRIYPVRNTDDTVVFLIDVPQSSNPPHQAPDKKYYLRHNFQNLAMPHYQVQALFQKRLRPEIIPKMTVTKFTGDGHVDLTIEIENHGGALAKYPMLMATITGCRSITPRMRVPELVVTPHEKPSGEYQVKYIDKDWVIHPGTKTLLARLNMNVDRVAVIAAIVGAEGMETTTFNTGVALSYLQTNMKPDSEIDLPLRMLSPPATDHDEYDEVIGQLGISPEDFKQYLMDIVEGKRDPVNVRDLILHLSQ